MRSYEHGIFVPKDLGNFGRTGFGEFGEFGNFAFREYRFLDRVFRGCEVLDIGFWEHETLEKQ